MYVTVATNNPVLNMDRMYMHMSPQKFASVIMLCFAFADTLLKKSILALATNSLSPLELIWLFVSTDIHSANDFAFRLKIQSALKLLKALRAVRRASVRTMLRAARRAMETFIILGTLFDFCRDSDNASHRQPECFCIFVLFWVSV